MGDLPVVGKREMVEGIEELSEQSVQSLGSLPFFAHMSKSRSLFRSGLTFTFGIYYLFIPSRFL
jgi:hypothetical protein